MAADAVERVAVSLLVGVSDLFDANAARRVAGGYNALLAHSPLGSAVGMAVNRFGAAAHPDRLLLTGAERRLRRLIAGRAHFPTERLGELEKVEFGTRHVGLAALTMMLWVIPFIYGTNPSRLRLNPKELATAVRRFRELLTRDMRNIGTVFPRDIACLTHIDLDSKQTAHAFQQTHAMMLEAIRRGRTTGPLPSSTPPYFGQRFHWRDWQDPVGASGWDAQVDALFAGQYGAMQRSVLPDILEGLILGAGQPHRILEVAGGTGSLANSTLRTLEWRGQLADVTYDFVEMSRANMAVAKRRLGRWGDRLRTFDFETTGACAERLPHPDASIDTVVAVNLLHELPPKIRRRAAAEFSRVLRPRGRLVFLDSAQLGDGIDSLLLAFGGNGRGPLPRGTFHEPFYQSYLVEDLAALFAREGLVPLGPPRYAYVAKQIVFWKPV